MRNVKYVRLSSSVSMKLILQTCWVNWRILVTVNLKIRACQSLLAVRMMKATSKRLELQLIEELELALQTWNTSDYQSKFGMAEKLLLLHEM